MPAFVKIGLLVSVQFLQGALKFICQQSSALHTHHFLQERRAAKVAHAQNSSLFVHM